MLGMATTIGTTTTTARRWRAATASVALAAALLGSACTPGVSDHRGTVAADPAQVRARLDEVHQITLTEPTGTYELVDELEGHTGSGRFQHDPLAYDVLADDTGQILGEGIAFSDKVYRHLVGGGWEVGDRAEIVNPATAGAIPAEVLRVLLESEFEPQQIDPGDRTLYEGYRWEMPAASLGYPEYEDVHTVTEVEVDEEGRVARIIQRIDPLSSKDGDALHDGHDHDPDMRGGTLTMVFTYVEGEPIQRPGG
jgi:hypothetical protein